MHRQPPTQPEKKLSLTSEAIAEMRNETQIYVMIFTARPPQKSV